MQTKETSSWKEKIDPAFEELIKGYMDFIKNWVNGGQVFILVVGSSLIMKKDTICIGNK